MGFDVVTWLDNCHDNSRTVVCFSIGVSLLTLMRMRPFFVGFVGWLEMLIFTQGMLELEQKYIVTCLAVLHRSDQADQHSSAKILISLGKLEASCCLMNEALINRLLNELNT